MKTYDEMLALAHERHARYEDAERRYIDDPTTLNRLNAANKAHEAGAYTQAVADMFGKTYYEVRLTIDAL